MQRTLIVSSSSQRAEATQPEQDDEISVATPLDAIARLERKPRIRTIVLTGAYARNEALAAFLNEFYPSVRVAREL